MMKHLMLAVVGLTLVSSPVFAASHCVGKDGQEISVASGSGKKAARCKAAGGRWRKIKKHTAAK